MVTTLRPVSLWYRGKDGRHTTILCMSATLPCVSSWRITHREPAGNLPDSLKSQYMVRKRHILGSRQSSCQQQLNVDDYVWARMNNFPAWPGKIIGKKVGETSSTWTIEWICGGDYSVDDVNTDDVFPFEEGGFQQGDCFVLEPTRNVHPKVRVEDHDKLLRAIKTAQYMKSAETDEFFNSKVIRLLHSKCAQQQVCSCAGSCIHNRKYWTSFVWYALRTSFPTDHLKCDPITAAARILQTSEVEIENMLKDVKNELMDDMDVEE